MAANNPVGKEVVIEAQGKSYTLRFGITAMITFQESASALLGRPVLFAEAMAGTDGESADPRLILAFVSACLETYHPGVAAREASFVADELSQIGMGMLMSQATPSQRDIDTLGVKPADPPTAQPKVGTGPRSTKTSGGTARGSAAKSSGG